MSRCVVCSRVGSARLMELTSGERIGPACAGECEILNWERHFNVETDAPPYEHALLAWRWRRHVAGLDGRTFLEPMPKSDAEKTLDRWALSLGVA